MRGMAASSHVCGVSGTVAGVGVEEHGRALAVLLAWLAFGCGVATEDAPPAAPAPSGSWHVVGRPAPAKAGQIHLNLDQEARHASSGRFELHSPGAGGRLSFSIGVRRGELAREPSRFSISARVADGWLPVYEELLPQGRSEWHDRDVDLAGEALGATHFRFESTPGTGPAGVQAFFGSPTLLARGAPRRPNVVFLILDTLGASYLSRYGEHAGVSPAIDGFLAEAYSFRRAYAQYGATLPSTTSLFTGLYPIHHGVYGHSGFKPGIDSLVGRLAAAGYFTEAITEGGYVSSGWGTSRGFDRYDNGPLQDHHAAGFAPRTFDVAMRWLEERGTETRFFLVVHTYEVHSPYLPRTEESRRIIEQLSPEDSGPLDARWQSIAILSHNSGQGDLTDVQLRRLKAHHLATVHELDAFVAAFLAKLAELGLEDDTLVVLLADHGDQFGEHGKLGHGETLHNRVLNVPLGFRWPRRIEPGESDAPVQLVDVIPTVLDLLELPVPEGIDGRSLAPLIRRSPDAPAPRPAFAELRGPNAECKRLGLPADCRLDRFAVQTERFKFVSSAVPPGEALYDLRADPLETRNVAADHPEEVVRHRALLDAYRATAREADAAAPGEQTMDPATRDRLEALGYLN